MHFILFVCFTHMARLLSCDSNVRKLHNEIPLIRRRKPSHLTVMCEDYHIYNIIGQLHSKCAKSCA